MQLPTPREGFTASCNAVKRLGKVRFEELLRGRSKAFRMSSRRQARLEDSRLPRRPWWALQARPVQSPRPCPQASPHTHSRHLSHSCDIQCLQGVALQVSLILGQRGLNENLRSYLFHLVSPGPPSVRRRSQRQCAAPCFDGLEGSPPPGHAKCMQNGCKIDENSSHLD